MAVKTKTATRGIQDDGSVGRRHEGNVRLTKQFTKTSNICHKKEIKGNNRSKKNKKKEDAALRTRARAGAAGSRTARIVPAKAARRGDSVLKRDQGAAG